MPRHSTLRTKHTAAAVGAAAAMAPDAAPEFGLMDSAEDHEEIARLAYEYWLARGAPKDRRKKTGSARIKNYGRQGAKKLLFESLSRETSIESV